MENLTALVVASTNRARFHYVPGHPIGNHVALTAPGYFRPVRVEVRGVQTILWPLATDEHGEPHSFVTVEEAEEVVLRYVHGPGDEEPARWDTTTRGWVEGR